MKKLFIFLMTILFSVLTFSSSCYASCEDIHRNSLSNGELRVDFINYGGNSGYVSNQNGSVLTPTMIESISDVMKGVYTTFDSDYLILQGSLEFLVYGNDPSQNPNTPVINNVSAPIIYYEGDSSTESYCEVIGFSPVYSGPNYIAEYNVSNLLTPKLNSYNLTIKCHRHQNFPLTRVNYILLFYLQFNSFYSDSFTLSSQYRINATFRDYSISVNNTCTNDDISESLDSISDSIVDVGDKLESIDSFMSDDDIDSAVLGADSFFSQSDNELTTFGLADFVTAGINFIKAIRLDYSCVPLQLPAIFGTRITLPCFTEWLYNFDEDIYNLYHIILTFYIGYLICCDLIRFIHNLRDPQNDNITVLEI